MTDSHSPEAIEAEELQMNASSPQQSPAEPFDDYDDGFDEVLPARPRARYLTPLTALLMALILGGVGFYIGIRVEKSQGSSTGAATAFRGLLGATGSTRKTGSASRTGFPGGSSNLASRFAGGGTVGSVSSVSGNTIYLQETSGNTVKVKLSSATKIAKSESVSRKRLYPGDQVVVAGSSGSNGTVHATSVTDSGASSTGSSASSSSSSSSTRNSASAISSLFGGG